MEKPPHNIEDEPDFEYKDLIQQHEEEIAQERAKEKVEYGPHAEELERLLAPLLDEELLATLNAVETESEAKNSGEREKAKEALIPAFAALRFLKRRTDIPEEEYDMLHEKYKTASRAVGMVNNGKVDHDR